LTLSEIVLDCNHVNDANQSTRTNLRRTSSILGWHRFDGEVRYFRKEMIMTLDKTWEECLRMWKWIDSEVEESYDDESPVEALKEDWMEKHGHDIVYNCFFCEYAKVKSGVKNFYYGNDACHDFCPVLEVDPDFDCCDDDCNFESNPKAFYRKLVELNKKRLG